MTALVHAGDQQGNDQSMSPGMVPDRCCPSSRKCGVLEIGRLGSRLRRSPVSDLKMLGCVDEYRVNANILTVGVDLACRVSQNACAKSWNACWVSAEPGLEWVPILGLLAQSSSCTHTSSPIMPKYVSSIATAAASAQRAPTSSSVDSRSCCPLSKYAASADYCPMAK